MRAWAGLAVFALGWAGSSCQLILGEHEIYGERRACSSDEDCHADERCDEHGNMCRLRCKKDEECPDSDKGWRSCADEKTCTEPIGTPCDSEDYSASSDDCGGGGNECLGEDSNDDPVLGYCTVRCYERDEGICPSGGVCDCPKGYICYKDACRQEAK